MTHRIHEIQGLSGHSQRLRTGWQAAALRATPAGTRSTAGDELSKSKPHDWCAAGSGARAAMDPGAPRCGGRALLKSPSVCVTETHGPEIRKKEAKRWWGSTSHRFHLLRLQSPPRCLSRAQGSHLHPPAVCFLSTRSPAVPRHTRPGWARRPCSGSTKAALRRSCLGPAGRLRPHAALPATGGKRPSQPSERQAGTRVRVRPRPTEQLSLPDRTRPTAPPAS